MLAVVLPGREFPVTRPALAAVATTVGEHGYDVRPVAWTLDGLPDDPDGFVLDRLAEAAPDGCDLLVAKSLGTRAAPYAADRALPAVWVTPLLRDATVLDAIRANPAPQLLVCGGDDPLHDPAAVETLSCDVLELPGADHALSPSGDGVVPAGLLTEIADATDVFLRRLR